MIKINENVPEGLVFEVFHNEKIKKVKLSDYKKKWVVLMFYPADFTFICPTEFEDMAELYEQFKKEGAEVISVSTDTAFAHKAWHDNSPSIKKVNFPMAADPTGKLCKLFGTYIDDEGLSLRGTFLIDPDGKLKAFEIHDNSVGRSAAETLRRLQAAKFVRDHGGEVCPAKWTPGKKTLRPGVDLVGKI